MPRQELLIDVGLDTAKLRNQALESKQELLKLMKDMKITPEVDWGDSLQQMIDQLTSIINTINSYSPDNIYGGLDSLKDNVSEIQRAIDTLSNNTNFQGKIDGIINGFERARDIVSELVSQARTLDRGMSDESSSSWYYADRLSDAEDRADELKKRVEDLSKMTNNAFSEEQAKAFLNILGEIRSEIEHLRIKLESFSSSTNNFFNVQKIELLSKSIETIQDVINHLSFGDQLIPEIQKIQGAVNELRESISSIQDVSLHLNLGGSRNGVSQNKEWGFVAKEALKDIKAQYLELVSMFREQDILKVLGYMGYGDIMDKSLIDSLVYAKFDKNTNLIDQVQTYKENIALLKEMTQYIRYIDKPFDMSKFDHAEASVTDILNKHAQIYEFTTAHKEDPIKNIFGTFDSTKITEQLDQIIVKLDEFNAAIQNTISIGGSLDLSGLNSLANAISGLSSGNNSLSTIQSEVNLFSSLNGAINTVSDSIARKNRAINNEGNIVKDTVASEIVSFQNLDNAIATPMQGGSSTQEMLNSLLQSHRQIIEGVTKTESDLFDIVISKAELLNSRISSGIGDLSSALTKLQSLGVANVKAPVIDEGVEARLRQIRQPLDSLNGSGLSNSYTAKLQSSIADIDKIEESYRKGTITLKEFTSAVNTAVKTLSQAADNERKAAEEVAAARKRIADEVAAAREKAAMEAAEAEKRAAEEAAQAAAQEAAEKKRVADEAAAAEKKERDALYDEYKEAQKKYKPALKQYESARYATKDNSAGLLEMQKNVEALKKQLDEAKTRLLCLHPTQEQLDAFDELAKYESDIRNSEHTKAVAKWGSVTGLNVNSIGNLEEAIKQTDALRKLSNVKITPKFESDSLKQFAVSGKNARGEIENMTFTVDKATGEVYKLTNASKQAASSTATMGSYFAQAANYLVRYFGMYMSAHRLFSEIRNGIGYVKELDTAMTEFQVVTKETDETLNKFADDAYDVANTVASTTAEIVKSSTEWARLGYNMNDSLVLAAQSAKLAKTGFMDVSQSTEQLTASIQAFYGADLKAGLVSAGEAATHVSDELVALGKYVADVA